MNPVFLARIHAHFNRIERQLADSAEDAYETLDAFLLPLMRDQADDLDREIKGLIELIEEARKRSHADAAKAQ